MKLDSLDLHHLRRALRGHPDIAQHVDDPTVLDRMRSSGLASLAKKLGADPAAMIEDFRRQDDERQKWSIQFPAFRGTLDFELAVEALGKRVTRKARVDYTFTPSWEYWDLRKRAPHIGWPGSGACVTVRTVPDKDMTPDGRPSWEKIDILGITEIWDTLDDAIEEQCRAEDAKRRRAAAGKRRGKNGA